MSYSSHFRLEFVKPIVIVQVTTLHVKQNKLNLEPKIFFNMRNQHLGFCQNTKLYVKQQN